MYNKTWLGKFYSKTHHKDDNVDYVLIIKNNSISLLVAGL